MLCIIQARMSSTRLPGKTLKLLHGFPMLKYVIENIRRSKKIKKIIVATSSLKKDNHIVNFCKINKIDYFRGNLKNVASRFYYILKDKRYKAFVRISGDSPLIDYRLLDKIIKIYNNGNFDICTNVMKRSFPKGQSIEVFSASVFLQNYSKIRDSFYLEHVTNYFYKNYKKFKIFNLSSKINYSQINLSIDTKTDFKKINKLINITKGRYASWQFYSKLYKEGFNDKKN